MNGARRTDRQIEDIVAAEAGASFGELADRTGVPYPEVKATVWRLYGAKRVDICQGYVVAFPRADEGRRSA